MNPIKRTRIGWAIITACLMVACLMFQLAAGRSAAQTAGIGVSNATADELLVLSSGTTSRVSVASAGTQGNGFSGEPSISADSRYVAFGSSASNLVPGDTNGVYDIFVHDRQTGQTSRVSRASDGTQANGQSLYPSISADGRYVAFDSDASNLVPGDTNGTSDVFVHDRQTGQTSRVSRASDGTQGNFESRYPSISANGRYVAFDSGASNLVPGDTNGTYDIFVHDRQTGQTSRVSRATDSTQGNEQSKYPSISADGRYVSFASKANNLIPGDTNGTDDVFVHDRQTGQTSRVSRASDGTQGNGFSIVHSISADGRYVAFASGASNLVPGDTNDATDVFVHDRQTGQTSRISRASDGIQTNPWSWSGSPSISADGRYVAFVSSASNLVPGDTNTCPNYPTSGSCPDVFVHDRQTGQTSRVSRASDGTQANEQSVYSSISADGRYVAFDSDASNLVPGDTNGTSDVFVHDRSGSDGGCTVPYFSQRDPQWINHPLRTGGACSAFCGTIGTCGCTLTSATMLFAYYGANTTPPQLSDCLGTQACPFRWGTAGTSCSQGQATFVNKYAFSWTILDQQLNQFNRPVLLGMHKGNNTNDTHWVLVISGQGSDPAGYTVHDPWPLNGANTSLSVLARNNYNFDWISVYSGDAACPLSSVQATQPQVQSKPVQFVPAGIASVGDSGELRITSEVTGTVWLYNMTEITMTLQLTATSSFGEISEVQVWTDANPNPVWQSFTEFVWLEWFPEHETIYARFRDEFGNESGVTSDTIAPVFSPPPEQPFQTIMLPLILRDP